MGDLRKFDVCLRASIADQFSALLVAPLNTDRLERDHREFQQRLDAALGRAGA